MLKVLSKGRDDEKGTMLQRRGLDGWNTQGNNKKYQNLKQIKFTQYIGSLYDWLTISYTSMLISGK